MSNLRENHKDLVKYVKTANVYDFIYYKKLREHYRGEYELPEKRRILKVK